MGVAHPRRALLLVMMEPEEGYADELNAWYDEEHLPDRLSCPGFIAARRFELLESSPEGQPHYLALYDLESAEVMSSEAYLAMVPLSAWSERLLPHVKVTRNVYSEITKQSPSDGGE
jgi:hypothetical protein